MTNTELNHSIASWDRQSKNPCILINIRRNTLIAFVISLAIHAAVLFSTRNFVIATASSPPQNLEYSHCRAAFKKNTAGHITKDNHHEATAC